MTQNFIIGLKPNKGTGTLLFVPQKLPVPLISTGYNFVFSRNYKS